MIGMDWPLKRIDRFSATRVQMQIMLNVQNTELELTYPCLDYIQLRAGN